MIKQVFLNLGNGNLHQGFPFVTVRLLKDGKTMEYAGSLPTAPNLIELYRRWQLLYDLLYKSRSFNIRSLAGVGDDDDEIWIDEADITNISATDFDDVCHELQQHLDRWLDSESFRSVERQLRKQLNPNDEISLIVQTEDSHLRKLPWYIWQFFHDYPKAEVSLGTLNFEPQERLVCSVGSAQSRSTKEKVRILAILGNSAGINLEQDRQLLTNLSGVEIVFLVEPQRQQLTETIWAQQGWDILFFAGHSSSLEDDEEGQIFINEQDSLTIPQLKNALSKAISRGVKLAIFNSCAGLGLAAQLTTLAIPQMIVMREPVPDRVAQEFLKYFLTAYAEGQSFSLAVREARERLQGIEGDFPGASWLPVIFQNPAEVPPTWEQLKTGIEAKSDWQSQYRERNRSSSVIPTKPKLSTIFTSSLIAAMVVAGLRWLGVLQIWELKAFDLLLAKLPPEPAHTRILIVGADDRDLNKYGYPLPDRTIAQVINKLQPEQPATIGIDIFRPYAVPESDRQGHRALVDIWQQNENIVTVCFGNHPDHNVPPPPTSPAERVGFIDLYDDRSVTGARDDSIRRYLLSRSPRTLYQASACNTDYSFALQLLYRYFQTKNIPVTTSGENWKFGNVEVKPLQTRSGGYQNLDGRGNQSLIFYRRNPQIAQQVTIRDVLEKGDRFDPDWVKNRVVLIGITQQAVSNDVHDTPQGEKYGIHIHAHAIGQIISAVEDNRPMLWWLPQGLDLVWIWLWSFAGGAMIWILGRPLARSLALVSLSVILFFSCWLILIQGGWFPLIPALISIYITASLAVAMINK